MATIRQIRERQGLLQRELADKAVVSEVLISRVENGKAVSKMTLRRICRALGVNESEVCGVRLYSDDKKRSVE